MVRAASAGLAGGIALTRSRQRKVLGIPLPGRSTTESRRRCEEHCVRSQSAPVMSPSKYESLARRSAETMFSRSPIEVVLEGLTRRSQAAKPLGAPAKAAAIERADLLRAPRVGVHPPRRGHPLGAVTGSPPTLLLANGSRPRYLIRSRTPAARPPPRAGVRRSQRTPASLPAPPPAGGLHPPSRPGVGRCFLAVAAILSRTSGACRSTSPRASSIRPSSRCLYS